MSQYLFDYSHLNLNCHLSKIHLHEFILFKYFQLQHSLVGQVPAETPQARRGDRVPAARRVSGAFAQR